MPVIYKSAKMGSQKILVLWPALKTGSAAIPEGNTVSGTWGGVLRNVTSLLETQTTKSPQTKPNHTPELYSTTAEGTADPGVAVACTGDDTLQNSEGVRSGGVRSKFYARYTKASSEEDASSVRVHEPAIWIPGYRMGP